MPEVAEAPASIRHLMSFRKLLRGRQPRRPRNRDLFLPTAFSKGATSPAQDNAPWLINGLPRSGQEQLAARLAQNGAAHVTELSLDSPAGFSGWPMDQDSSDFVFKSAKTLAADCAPTTAVIFMRSPLLATDKARENNSAYLIHMVRDPRQLFAAYARRPQFTEFIQFARVARNARHVPQFRPLWESSLPAIDLLSSTNDSSLRDRLAVDGAWPMYAVLYYFWMLSLLRNLGQGALCVELSTLATSAAARADFAELFAAFGLQVSLRPSRVDRYASHDISTDLGLPPVRWGSRLEQQPRYSHFSAPEAQVVKLLEDAADMLHLRIDEKVALDLTTFINPAYALMVMPFTRPWFAKTAPVRNARTSGSDD